MMHRPDILGLLPARGGSKSIPLKNIVPVMGHPLLAYAAAAGRQAATVTRLACSTENARIAKVCRQCGLEVFDRPKALAADDTPVVDVLIDLLHRLRRDDNYTPEAVVLLQPTSPFVLPAHVDECVNKLLDHVRVGSVQTITPVPHNHHAYNQRVVSHEEISFRFPNQRAQCYNKQRKPAHYVFGNLVVTRVGHLLKSRQVFASPSLAHVIPPAYALDVDTAEDLALADFFLRTGRVTVPLQEDGA